MKGPLQPFLLDPQSERPWFEIYRNFSETLLDGAN